MMYSFVWVMLQKCDWCLIVDFIEYEPFEFLARFYKSCSMTKWLSNFDEKKNKDYISI